MGFLPKQGGFLWAECRKSAEIPAVHLFCEKNRKIRVDKTNRLWYSVLATRLDKSNHAAPEKRKPLQGLLRKPDPPWQSCGAVSGDPQVCRGEATPSCLRKTALWLKSPTGAFIAPLRCANASLPMAGRAGSSFPRQRETARSRRGTPCCTYRCCLWLLAGCVRVGAPFFCFIFFKSPDCLFVFYNNVTNCI